MIVYEVMRESFGQPISMGLFLHKEHAENVASYWNTYSVQFHAMIGSKAEIFQRKVATDLTNGGGF